MDPDLWAEFVAATRDVLLAHAKVEAVNRELEDAEAEWRNAQIRHGELRRRVEDAAKAEVVEDVGGVLEGVPA